jgi:fructokinase
MRPRLSVLVVGELIADAVVAGDGAEGPTSASPGVGPTAVGEGWGRALTGRISPSTEALGLLVRPGGSPANTAVGLARLGVAVGFVGRLSTSGLGPWLTSHLTANGVDVSLSVAAPEAPTLAMVALDAEGMASYSFYGVDTADWQWRREELPDIDRLSVAAVHTGSLATAVEPGAAALASWISRLHGGAGDVLISYDPNVRPSRIADAAAFTARARTLVRQAHLVKVSEGDLAFMHPQEDPVEVVRAWAGEGPELVVLTRGPRQALAFRPDGSCVAGPEPSGAVVDTVGAGDAFSAGLLAWLLEAGALWPGGVAQLPAPQLLRALDVAGRAASVACARPGADPPHRAEVADGPWPGR